MYVRSAVCVLTHNDKDIEGSIEFHENTCGTMDILIHITHLPPNTYHGIHIHKSGDLRKGCDSLCSHFNPYNKEHGDISDDICNRHIGDLGNIWADKNGIVDITIKDRYITLYGTCNIIGRSVVIHEHKDDLGVGGLDSEGKIKNNEIWIESKKTGNAGKRIACGVIGWIT